MPARELEVEDVIDFDAEDHPIIGNCFSEDDQEEAFLPVISKPKPLRRVVFSCNLSLKRNDKDEMKKDMTGMPSGWTKLSKSKINQKHNAHCLITGEKQNLVVIDCDTKEGVCSYETLIKDYPILNESYTVKTRNGYHIYTQFTKGLTSTDDVFKDYPHVDIKTDGGMVFCPPTTYKNDETKEEYKYVVFKDMEECVFPEDLKLNLKGKKEKKKKKKKKVADRNDNGIYNFKEYKAQTKINQHEIKDLINIIDIEYIDNRSDWRNLVWALASVNLRTHAKVLSQRSKKYDKPGFVDMWNSYDNREGGIEIGTFYKYAIDSNPMKYRLIRSRYEIQDNWTSSSEDGIARLFVKYFGNDFVFNDGKIYHYNGFTWVYEKTGVSIRNIIRKDLVMMYQEKIREIYKESSEENTKVVAILNKIISKCQKYSSVVSISKFVTESVINENIRWDSKDYLYAFNNKIYNLDEMKFVTPNKEDYINICTGYDYRKPKDKELKIIRDILEEIFPLEEERICYLVLLVTSLYGRVLEKFILANGSGRNGKGVLNELQMKVAGEYGYVLPNAVLLAPLENKSGPNPAVANLHQKRFVNSREPDSDRNLNCGTIKELTGGSELNARQCNSNNTKTDNKQTHFMECNQRPKLNGDDFATQQRIIDVMFRSKFVEDPEEHMGEYIYKQNKDFKDELWQHKHKFALFQILVEDYLPIYLKNNKNIDVMIPKAFKLRAQTYINDSNSIYNFLLEFYDNTKDKADVIKIKDFYEDYKDSSTDYPLMSAREKKKHNLSYFRDKVKTSTAFQKHVVDILQQKNIEPYNKKYGTNVVKMTNVIVGWVKKPDEPEMPEIVGNAFAKE